MRNLSQTNKQTNKQTNGNKYKGTRKTPRVGAKKAFLLDNISPGDRKAAVIPGSVAWQQNPLSLQAHHNAGYSLVAPKVLADFLGCLGGPVSNENQER
jgi:hypothetical protein